MLAEPPPALLAVMAHRIDADADCAGGEGRGTQLGAASRAAASSPSMSAQMNAFRFTGSLDALFQPGDQDPTLKDQEDPASFSRAARSASLESVSSTSSYSSSCGRLSGRRRSVSGDAGVGSSKMAWTPEEDAAIASGVRRFGYKWSRIRATLPATSDGRSDDAVRNRWQRIQRKQSRTAAKGAPNDAAEAPGKYGDMWTVEEDEAIDEGVALHGFVFRAIATQLPGRTESGCRNRWLRNQQRRLAGRGVRVRGAQEVFAALQQSGELSEAGEYRPLPAERPGADADSIGAHSLFPPASPPPFPPRAALAPAEPMHVHAEASAEAAAHALPLPLPLPLPLASTSAVGHASGVHAADTMPCALPSYPWESHGAIQALRESVSSAVNLPPAAAAQPFPWLGAASPSSPLPRDLATRGWRVGCGPL